MKEHRSPEQVLKEDFFMTDEQIDAARRYLDNALVENFFKSVTKDQITFPKPILEKDLSKKTTSLTRIETLLDAKFVVRSVIRFKGLDPPGKYFAYLDCDSEGCTKYIYKRFSEDGIITFTGDGNTPDDALLGLCHRMANSILIKTDVYQGFSYETHVLKLGMIQKDLDGSNLLIINGGQK